MNKCDFRQLEEIGNNRKQWDRIIEINGDLFIYNSAKNEFRKVVKQPSGEILVLVGCMAFGRFVYCSAK